MEIWIFFYALIWTDRIITVENISEHLRIFLGKAQKIVYDDLDFVTEFY